MLRRGFDKPVINLHELTNGLESYYNTKLNKMVLGKPKNSEWGYYQTLSEIVALLESADHYITSRLAHYHLENRQDPIGDLLQFYEYLNHNFYIISARRRNLFEYGLSWCINAHSKRLNVYDPNEKINTFHNIYQTKITVHKEIFVNHLNNYIKYTQWAEKYFKIQSVFYYDDSVNTLEKYIFDLEFMKDSRENNSWESMFGQSFNQYNTCHRLLPDLFLKNTQGPNQLLLKNPMDKNKWDALKGSNWLNFDNIDGKKFNNLPLVIQQEIAGHFQSNLKHISVSDDIINFLNQHFTQYSETYNKLDKLVDDGFLVTNIPIKLQTLNDKKMLVENFDESINWYNKWAQDNNFEIMLPDNLYKLANQEEKDNRSIIESTNFLAVKTS
jgi:hypothetical protein